MHAVVAMSVVSSLMHAELVGSEWQRLEKERRYSLSLPTDLPYCYGGFEWSLALIMSLATE